MDNIKVYRVEHTPKEKGLWRKFDGTWEPLFDMLTDGKCRDLPMEFDPIYGEEGTRWFASAPSKETLQKWFSKRDLEELVSNGFTINEFTVSRYKILNEFEYIFPRENIVERRILDVRDIYPLTLVEKRLIFSDLAARVGTNTKIKLSFNITNVNDLNEETITHHESNSTIRGAFALEDDFVIVDSGHHWHDLEDIKPYLRPMEDMTDEEWEEYYSFDIYVHLEDGTKVPNSAIFDFLNYHHIDFNGLILKGYALKAEEGMYD